MDNLQLIQSKIYEIRGQKVMLDFDLAEMYCVETKRLKEAVRRNIDRFEGDDFMFELTKKEITELSRTQFATLNKGRGSNIKYLPFAFTELGVAMLSSVLNSKPAIEINRGIMRAFVVVRQMLSNPIESRVERIETQVKELKQYMEEVLVDQNDINDDTMIQLELINQTLAELQTKDRGFKERKGSGISYRDAKKMIKLNIKRMDKKEVIFVLLNNFADWEGAYISTCLNMGVKPGCPIKYKVKTLSLSKEPITSIGGFRVLPDYDINDLPDDHAGLILIGGMNWFLPEAKPIASLVEKAIAESKLVAGICNASVYLGMYGFLNHVKHTSNTLDYLKQYAGTQYTGETNYINDQAVRDNNIVTANGNAPLEFCREILYQLDAATPEIIEETYSFYKNEL